MNRLVEGILSGMFRAALAAYFLIACGGGELPVPGPSVGFL